MNDPPFSRDGRDSLLSLKHQKRRRPVCRRRVEDLWTGADGGTGRRAPRSKCQMTKRTSPFLPNFACGQTRACPEQTGEGRRELLPPGDLLSLLHNAGSWERPNRPERSAETKAVVLLRTFGSPSPPSVTRIPTCGREGSHHKSRSRSVAAHTLATGQDPVPWQPAHVAAHVW